MTSERVLEVEGDNWGDFSVGLDRRRNHLGQGNRMPLNAMDRMACLGVASGVLLG